MPDAQRFRKLLVATRLTIGFLMWVFPRTFARFLGVDAAANRALPFVARTFASREALMAYQLYQASDEELEEVLRQGILIDGMDIGAFTLALLRGEMSFRTFFMLTSTAGSAIAAGVMSRVPQQTR